MTLTKIAGKKKIETSTNNKQWHRLESQKSSINIFNALKAEIWITFLLFIVIVIFANDFCGRFSVGKCWGEIDVIGMSRKIYIFFWNFTEILTPLARFFNSYLGPLGGSFSLAHVWFFALSSSYLFSRMNHVFFRILQKNIEV